MQHRFDLEAQGLKSEEPRNRAEWARLMSSEIRKQGMARSKGTTQANGEVLPSSDETFLCDTLAVPDLEKACKPFPACPQTPSALD